jgi:hypothetical protein
VNARLIRETGARSVDEWHSLDVLRVESQIAGQTCVLLQTFGLLLRLGVQRRMEVSIDPLEGSIDRNSPSMACCCGCARTLRPLLRIMRRCRGESRRVEEASHQGARLIHSLTRYSPTPDMGWGEGFRITTG